DPVVQLTHAQSAHRLILARHDSGGYVIGWAAPWQATIDHYHYRTTEKAARNVLTAMQAAGPPPAAALTRDWQRALVYRWEALTLDRASPPVTPAQCAAMADRISADFNLAAAPAITH